MRIPEYFVTSVRKSIKCHISYIHSTSNFLLGLLACLNFTVRNLLFGSSNALNYLRGVHNLGVLLILKLYGAQIGQNCDIQSGITFHNCRNFKKLRIGDNCHIGKNCFFDLRDSVTIKDNVVISMYCRFVTHIDMTKSGLSDEFPATNSSITVGTNSYLGIGSTVLMGVDIGSDVLVGANSLVKNSIADNCRVAGTPCRPIDCRKAK